MLARSSIALFAVALFVLALAGVAGCGNSKSAGAASAAAAASPNRQADAAAIQDAPAALDAANPPDVPATADAGLPADGGADGADSPDLAGSGDGAETAPADAQLPDVLVGDAAPIADGPAWTVANGCATPVPWLAPACAAIKCGAGQACMGAGVCLPAATFFPGPPAGETSIALPALAAHESGAWGMAISAGTVDTGMGIYIQVYPQGDANGSGWLKLSPAGAVNHRMPSACSLGAGGWLVVWRAEDESKQAVAYMGRIAAADGQSAPGQPLALNTTLLGLGESSASTNVVAPVVLRLRDNTVLAAWSGGAAGKGVQMAIFARRFAADGGPLGAEMPVTQLASGAVAASPGIAPLTGGNALLVWELHGSFKKDDPFVQGRLMDSQGQLGGAAAALSPQLKPYEALPAVTGFADGSALITWKTANGNGATTAVDVMARRVSGDGPGTTKGALHKVDADATGVYPYRASATAMVDQRAAVAWHNASALPYTIQFSRYYPVQDVFDCQPTDVAGPLGPQESGARHLPEIAAFTDHRLLVAWNTAVAGPNGGTTSAVALRFFGW